MDFKKLFVVVCTTIAVLTIFLIMDAVFAGILSLIVSLIKPSMAISVFEGATSLLFILESCFVVPCAVQYYRKGDID